MNEHVTRRCGTECSEAHTYEDSCQLAPEPAADEFDGCSRECRKRQKHTLKWGDCEHGVQPAPTLGVWRTFTADDGHLAIGEASISLALFLPWAVHLPVAEQHQMLEEIVDADSEDRAAEIAAWKATAEALADPTAREVLLGQSGLDVVVGAGRPAAETESVERIREHGSNDDLARILAHHGITTPDDNVTGHSVRFMPGGQARLLDELTAWRNAAAARSEAGNVELRSQVDAYHREANKMSDRYDGMRDEADLPRARLAELGRPTTEWGIAWPGENPVEHCGFSEARLRAIAAGERGQPGRVVTRTAYRGPWEYGDGADCQPTDAEFDQFRTAADAPHAGTRPGSGA